MNHHVQYQTSCRLPLTLLVVLRRRGRDDPRLPLELYQKMIAEYFFRP